MKENQTVRRIQYHKYGGPDLMRLENFELGLPGTGEVAVKVWFAAINPIDWKLRGGQMKIVTGRAFPRGMGMDLSGIVMAVGPGVTRFAVGDPVFGLAGFKQSGALGEAVITKEGFIARKPDTVSFEDAACLGTPGITAWNGLVDKAKLMAGRNVFVNGCAGAVGEAAVQIARMLGATVSGSCGADGMERARTLGVANVFDYRLTDLSKWTERFDVVYDTAATMNLATGFGMLRESGVFLDLNPSPGKFIRAMFDRRLKLIIGTPRPDILDGIARAAADGKLRLPVGRIVPLSGAIDLVSALESGTRIGGKGVVSMG